MLRNYRACVVDRDSYHSQSFACPPIVEKENAMADVMKIGSFGWNELATTDPIKCKEFYTKLFGWTTEDSPMPHGVYTVFSNDGQKIAGMLQMTAEWGTSRPHWMPYVTVADTDASAKRVAELGGKVCVPPTDIPNIGRFAVVEDPVGGDFSIMKWKQ